MPEVIVKSAPSLINKSVNETSDAKLVLSLLIIKPVLVPVNDVGTVFHALFTKTR